MTVGSIIFKEDGNILYGSDLYNLIDAPLKQALLNTKYSRSSNGGSNMVGDEYGDLYSTFGTVVGSLIGSTTASVKKATVGLSAQWLANGGLFLGSALDDCNNSAGNIENIKPSTWWVGSSGTGTFFPLQTYGSYSPTRKIISVKVGTSSGEGGGWSSLIDVIGSGTSGVWNFNPSVIGGSSQVRVEATFSLGGATNSYFKFYAGETVLGSVYSPDGGPWSDSNGDSFAARSTVGSHILDYYFSPNSASLYINGSPWFGPIDMTSETKGYYLRWHGSMIGTNLNEGVSQVAFNHITAAVAGGSGLVEVNKVLGSGTADMVVADYYSGSKIWSGSAPYNVVEDTVTSTIQVKNDAAPTYQIIGKGHVAKLAAAGSDFTFRIQDIYPSKLELGSNYIRNIGDMSAYMFTSHTT